MKKRYNLRLSILILGCCFTIASPVLADREQTRAIGISEATEIIQQKIDGKVLDIKPDEHGYRAKVMHNGRIRIIQISKSGKLIRQRKSDNAK